MISFFYDSYQLILFFLFPGILLGAIYDVFRILRIARTDKQNQVSFLLQTHFKIEKISKVQSERKRAGLEFTLVLMEDILFCIIAAMMEILLFYHLNSGIIRIYGLLLSLIGFLLYRISIGKLVIGIAKQIIRFFRRLLYWCLLIPMTPVVMIGRKINRMVKNHKNHSGTKKKKAKRKAKKGEGVQE